MRVREIWEAKNRMLIGAAAALLLLLGMGTVFQADAGYETPVLSGGGGPWTNITDFPGCAEGTLCAEWPEANGNYSVVCCIPATNVDLDSAGSCQVFLFRRPLV